MDKKDVIGQYLEDVKPYFPHMEFVEVEKDGVRNPSAEEGPYVIRVRTEDGIIIGVE
jgi:hypothetical protein